MATNGDAPALTGFHHFSPTVSNINASAAWYQRVFRLDRVPVTFPHHDDENGGYAVLLTDPRSGIAIGLHHHAAHEGGTFHENRTGLDHMSFSVADRAALDDWARWLDDQKVDHSGPIDVTSPIPYAAFVFRDPDNIQLELIHMPT